MIDFFYSDPHYGHANIIAHSSRPFADVHEMNAELERRYCEAVGPDDCVLWCGDVSFMDRLRTSLLLARLPGRKLLVRGNHDGSVTRCLGIGFELVAEQLVISIAGHKVTCCHYPPLLENDEDRRHPDHRPPYPPKGEFVLHGHTHQKERRIGRMLHVGVDAWDFAPVPIAEVAKLIEGRS